MCNKMLASKVESVPLRGALWSVLCFLFRGKKGVKRTFMTISEKEYHHTWSARSRMCVYLYVSKVVYISYHFIASGVVFTSILPISSAKKGTCIISTRSKTKYKRWFFWPSKSSKVLFRNEHNSLAKITKRIYYYVYMSI